MLLISLILVMVGALNGASAADCRGYLGVRNEVGSGQLIDRILRDGGEKFKASNIGLIEIWSSSGETILSPLYWTTDGSDPLTPAQGEAYLARFGRRAHLVERTNIWKMNLRTGQLIVHSQPRP